MTIEKAVDLDKFNHDSMDLYGMQDKLLEYCIKRREEQSVLPLPKSLVKYIIEEIKISNKIPADPNGNTRVTCKYCDWTSDIDIDGQALYEHYKCSKSKAITGAEYLEYIEDLKNEKKDLENKIKDLEKYKAKHESKYYS
jgi:hypothetical protein